MRALAVLASLSLLAQEPGFRVQSRLVLVPVVVTDERGQPVDGLAPEDFLLLDDGKPRQIAVDTFSTGVAPIALSVVVETAGISWAVLDKVRKTASMMQPLVAGSRGCAGLIGFDETVTTLTNCTRDPDALRRAFAALKPGAEKKARLLDAVREAAIQLRRRENSRRVLLLISESKDRGSETELEDVLRELHTSGVAVYAATYSAFRTAFATRSTAPPAGGLDPLLGLRELIRLGKLNHAQALAAATGGITYPFTRQRALENAIETLGTELHTQYVLGFTPEEKTPPGLHRIEVRVRRAGRFTVRARPVWRSGD